MTTYDIIKLADIKVDGYDNKVTVVCGNTSTSFTRFKPNVIGDLVAISLWLRLNPEAVQIVAPNPEGQEILSEKLHSFFCESIKAGEIAVTRKEVDALPLKVSVCDIEVPISLFERALVSIACDKNDIQSCIKLLHKMAMRRVEAAVENKC